MASIPPTRFTATGITLNPSAFATSSYTVTTSPDGTESIAVKEPTPEDAVAKFFYSVNALYANARSRGKDIVLRGPLEISSEKDFSTMGTIYACRMKFSRQDGYIGSGSVFSGSATLYGTTPAEPEPAKEEPKEEEVSWL